MEVKSKGLVGLERNPRPGWEITISGIITGVVTLEILAETVLPDMFARGETAEAEVGSARDVAAEVGSAEVGVETGSEVSVISRI